jgi:hypothetical protein
MEDIDMSLYKFLDRTCSFCGNFTDFKVALPCNHFFCTFCFASKWKSILERLLKTVKLNPLALNNKFSGIGCFDQSCNLSAFSVPAAWLEKVFKRENEERYVNLTRFFSTFLSGIPTCFYRCDTCGNTHGTIDSNLECKALSLELIN